MASYTIANRLHALERATYEPEMRAVVSRFAERACILWPDSEVARFQALFEQGGTIPPDLFARITADAELDALWSEFCRLAWLHFNSRTGGVTSEHSYYS